MSHALTLSLSVCARPSYGAFRLSYGVECSLKVKFTNNHLKESKIRIVLDNISKTFQVFNISNDVFWFPLITKFNILQFYFKFHSKQGKGL